MYTIYVHSVYIYIHTMYIYWEGESGAVVEVFFNGREVQRLSVQPQFDFGGENDLALPCIRQNSHS